MQLTQPLRRSNRKVDLSCAALVEEESARRAYLGLRACKDSTTLSTERFF